MGDSMQKLLAITCQLGEEVIIHVHLLCRSVGKLVGQEIERRYEVVHGYHRNYDRELILQAPAWRKT